MRIAVHHYDAFASVPGKGNPAGVVLAADGLSEAQMQEIARQVGFNETAFVLKSDSADLRLRYYTPGHEVDLCGHATVGSLCALNQRALLPPGDYSVETKAGVLPMSVTEDRGGTVVWMTQAAAKFASFEGDPAALATVIGLSVDDLRTDLPIVYGSTGLWTLIVPVTGLDAMRRMRPANTRFPDILTQMPRASVHPMCIETTDPAADMHGRHFSSPYSGTVEDPVTGTASGVMGAYYAKYMARQEGEVSLVVEQGQEIGRDGRVRVEVTAYGGEFRVRIGGTAVHVADMQIAL